MSLGYCIPDLIAARRIPAEHANDLRALYDELVAQHSGRMGREAAEALATQQAVDAWEAGIRSARRQTLLSMNRQDAILAAARTGYRGANPDGPIDPRALTAMLAWDRRATYPNVEYVEREVRGSALGQMYDVLAQHRADLMGHVRNPDDLQLMVRELHGEDTGDLNARELADAWRQTAEGLRQRFNASGGAVGALDDWGLPHAHDPMRVGAIDPEAWIDDVMPRLDRARMLDNRTLQPMADEPLRDLLRRTYDRIVSDGWVGRQPGAGGAQMLANRNAEHRILHFRTAADWLAYNERFGSSTPWDAMMGHVHRMSRDIAMVEVLGPNPAATVRWMKDVAAKDAAERGNAADVRAAKAERDRVDKIWSVLSGAAGQPVSETLANIGASIRQWQAATKLGSAVVASMSDNATMALTRHYNGLSATMQLPDMIAALAGDTSNARRHGIISDEFVGHAAGAGRLFLEEVSGGRYADGVGRAERWSGRANETTRRLADGVLRTSGLNAWTIKGREATAKEFAATFAEQAGTPWAALDAQLRGFFERYGLGEDEWNQLRATAPNHDGGYGAIWPDMIENRALGRRLQQAMLTEIDFAIPTGGVRQRALLAGYQPGTVMGELARTAFQFKMFPVTVMTMHALRMLDMPGPWSRARYAALFLGGTTMMGALSYQLANLVQGKDPSHMDTKDFWWRATLKGGGLGVFGDMVNNSMNQYGQNIGDIMIGPSWSTAQELGKLALGKESERPDGSTYRERDWSRFLQRETPGGSIWYLRSGYQRLLLDSIKEAQGEGYAESYDRMRQRAAKDGTAYFYGPGDRTPIRMPDLGAAFAATPADNAIDDQLTVN